MANMDSLRNVYVEITEQPMGKGLRFRYISEGRTAGSIQGEHSTNEHRTFPSIKIHNYSGIAVAVVSCVTTDRPARPHPHHLVGTNCFNGICRVQINSSSEPIPFANIGVQCCTRKDIGRNLEERRSMNIDPFNTGHPTNYDSVDLTTICLCFQVYANINGTMVALNPVVSNPIMDKKVCSELSIVRLSRISGSVRGGDEVFLLCSKVKKEDIKVIFSHRLENGESWEKEGSFSSTDVHKQYVVVFKTPPYCEADIKRPVDVCLYLMRPSDNAVGEAKTFTYYPENPDPFGINAKRKRLTQTYSSYFTPPFDMPSGQASLTRSHHLQPRQFTGLADHSGQWNYTGFPASVTPKIPKIKYEMPVSQIKTSFCQPFVPTSAVNSYAFPDVPVSVPRTAFGRRRMVPSPSRGKDSRFYKASSDFLETELSSSLTSSSALELLVTSPSNAMSGSTSVNCSLNHAASSYINSPSAAVFENSMQPQNNNNITSSAANPDFATDDLDIVGLSSNLPDDAAFRDVLSDDIFRMLVTSDEQKNVFSGVGTDFPVLTDEDFNCFTELLQ